MTGRTTRLLAALSCGVIVIAAVPTRGVSQTARQQQSSTETRLRAQRDELERIRHERDALRQRMEQLRGNVHDLSEEMTNLDRQADATSRVVQALDAQLVAISGEVGEATGSLVRAEDELETKKAVLRRRLVDIYKRGPLYSYEALLSAQSFGDLVARYKYLHLLALRDRALVRRVEDLRNHIGKQRNLLVRLKSDVEENRVEKQDEERRLRELEAERGRSLAQTKRSVQQAGARLAQIDRAEARLRDVIGSLEVARRRAESRPNATASATASAIRTSDLGKLDWPVDGSIIYRFGRVVNPNNTTTRWNGIGIASAAGTPVRAIAAGDVAMVRQMGTYGLTVIVQHGGGDYSIYGSLARADVREGQRVTKGQAVGTVGSSDPELPAHLHFEIRRARGAAVDPLDWLRGER